MIAPRSIETLHVYRWEAPCARRPIYDGYQHAPHAPRDASSLRTVARPVGADDREGVKSMSGPMNVTTRFSPITPGRRAVRLRTRFPTGALMPRVVGASRSVPSIYKGGYSLRSPGRAGGKSQCRKHSRQSHGGRKRSISTGSKDAVPSGGAKRLGRLGGLFPSLPPGALVGRASAVSTAANRMVGGNGPYRPVRKTLSHQGERSG